MIEYYFLNAYMNIYISALETARMLISFYIYLSQGDEIDEGETVEFQMGLFSFVNFKWLHLCDLSS